MFKRNIVLLFLLVGKSLIAQDVKCDLFKSLHHDNNNKLSFFNNEKINVRLKKGVYFDFALSDSTLVYSSNTKEIKVRPIDASPYSIIIKDDILITDAKDSINPNVGLDSLSNIETSKEFSSTWKIGKSSFLDILYKDGKASEIQISELQRNVSIWISYVENNPEIKKIKITWLNSGNYFLIVYSPGNHPYILDYYDASKKAGLALFFKFGKNFVSDALLYEMTGKIDNNEDQPLGNYSFQNNHAKNLAGIKYNKRHIIRRRFNKSGCEAFIQDIK